MDKREDIDNIIKNIHLFYNLIKDKYPVKNILLYGSWAKNKSNSDSDIDICIVMDYSPKKNFIKLTAELFHFSKLINTALEPRAISFEDYNNPAPASILSEIKKTGKVII